MPSTPDWTSVHKAGGGTLQRNVSHWRWTRLSFSILSMTCILVLDSLVDQELFLTLLKKSFCINVCPSVGSFAQQFNDLCLSCIYY